MSDIRTRLLALRQQLGSVDPTKDQVAGNNTIDTGLREQLSALEAQLVYQSSQLKNPDAPQIAKTKAQITATQAQLAAIDGRFKHDRGGNVALASAVGEYERLDTERRSEEQALFNSLQLLQQASIGADDQRLYLSTYVRPVAPEISTYPERLKSILVLALVSGLIWLIGTLLGKSVMDHVR